jgi:RNA polymerase sigma factor (sigma-70 family)
MKGWKNIRTMSDWELIELYAKSGSEPAFAELVRRHLGWVHSVAMRQVRQPQLAEEVAQSVFVLLARKAGSLRSGTILGGWLFRTTCFVGSRALRAEQRQKNREQTASSMIAATTLPEENEAAWQRLEPHLDQVVAALSEPDRAAILLRFYEKQPLLEVGRRLGISEEAAKKRVSRAVDKMRTLLVRRGVTVGSTVLVAVLAQKTVQAAPAALGTSVLEAAAAGVSVSAVLPQLARETLAAWCWATVKLAAGLAATSMALIFLAASAGGLFTRHTASQPVSVSDSPRAGVTTTATEQVADALSAPAAKEGRQAFGKTGALTGLVADNQGHLISGAKVWGGFGEQPFAQDTTDTAGQFALDKIATPPFVTVTADGFAADQQEFDPTNVAGMLVFRLNPVRPLNVRLVDESGQGLPGVPLFLAHWWGRSGTLGQHLRQQTDADGRLQWLSPPKGELELSFAKTGYRYSRTNKLAADGEEHTIVLHPAATVTGSVTDAETGAPVTSFKFTAGHSQPWNPADPTPMWDYRGQTSTNGFYKMVIEEEQVPYLRVEADGYETVETEIQLTNGVEGVRDFQLRRQSAANSIRGTVLMADGSPAAGLEVALCTAHAGVMLSGTAFAPGAFGNIPRSQRGDYRRKTDEHGFFSFDPKPGAHTVVAAGVAGLGHARCFDLSKPLEIRLQPWGRIEGTVRTRDGQWGGRKVAWSHSGNLTSWTTLFFDARGFSALSDPTGGFTLEHVPPGECRVAVGDDSDIASIFSPSIRVNPGETAEVQVGGVGCPVTGKLVAPPGLEIRSWPNQVTLARLYVEWDDYHVPKGLTGNAVERWKLEFEDTEAGRTWFRDQFAYDFKVGADGSFTIPEVLPGKYQLFIDVGQGYLGSGPDSSPSPPGDARIASIAKKFTVPEAAGEDASRLDLGDITLIADH